MEGMHTGMHVHCSLLQGRKVYIARVGSMACQSVKMLADLDNETNVELQNKIKPGLRVRRLYWLCTVLFSSTHISLLFNLSPESEWQRPHLCKNAAVLDSMDDVCQASVHVATTALARSNFLKNEKCIEHGCTCCTRSTCVSWKAWLVWRGVEHAVDVPRRT